MLEKIDLYRQVARLHMENISQGFLPTLGFRFVTLMYRAIDECDCSVLLVDVQGERVIGFISGTTHMGAIYKHMFRYWPQLGVALLPSLLNFKRIKRIIEILHYSRTRAPEAELPRSELLSIAVDPSCRGQRRADALYISLMNYFRKQGQGAFRITVGNALSPAHSFYRRMGAISIVETEVHRGELSTIYVQKIA